MGDSVRNNEAFQVQYIFWWGSNIWNLRLCIKIVLGGSASSGGAGSSSVSPDKVATGTGTGVAQAGPGIFSSILFYWQGIL